MTKGISLGVRKQFAIIFKKFIPRCGYNAKLSLKGKFSIRTHSKKSERKSFISFRSFRFDSFYGSETHTSKCNLKLQFHYSIVSKKRGKTRKFNCTELKTRSKSRDTSISTICESNLLQVGNILL